MEVKEKGRGLNFRFLFPAFLAWLGAAALLLLVAAAVITLLDLKASGFKVFGAAIGLLSAAAAGYSARRHSQNPAVQTALLTAGALIIFLLTLGFLVSQERMNAGGILTVAAATLLGSFLGAIISRKKKKLQKRKPIQFAKKKIS